MELKPGYKQTEVGLIPEDWSLCSLEDVTMSEGLVRGPFGGTLKKKFFVAKGYKVYEQRNAIYGTTGVGTYFIDDHKYKELIRFDVKPGDFIVSCSGTIGCIYRIPNGAPRGVINQALLKISIDPNKIVPYYFFVTFCSPDFQNRIKENTHGGAMQNLVGMSIFRKTVLPLPPLTQQRAIATALSDVDALTAKLDQLIAKKRDLKQAAMQQLLTGRTRLPGFSGEWEIKRLGGVAALNRLNIVPAQQPDKEFAHFSLPAFDAARSLRIELGSSIGSNKFAVPPDAVLVSRLNPRIPRVWAPPEVPENSVASTEWLILTPHEGFDRRYLYILCSSPEFCERMELLATGTTGSHQRINPGTAMNIRLHVTIDPDEQTAITTVLADMDAEIAALEARRDRTRAIKQGMIQALLTGQVRLPVSAEPMEAMA